MTLETKRIFDLGFPFWPSDLASIPRSPRLRATFSQRIAGKVLAVPIEERAVLIPTGVNGKLGLPNASSRDFCAFTKVGSTVLSLGRGDMAIFDTAMSGSSPAFSANSSLAIKRILWEVSGPIHKSCHAVALMIPECGALRALHHGDDLGLLVRPVRLRLGGGLLGTAWLLRGLGLLGFALALRLRTRWLRLASAVR